MRAAAPRLAYILLGSVASCSLFVACAAGTDNTFTATATGHPSTSTSGAGGNSSGGNGGGGMTGLGGGFMATGGGSSNGGSTPGATYAYAHTNTQLYKFDPTQSTISMQLVGTFDCIGGGTSSSSSSSSSSGAPTTCSEVDGTVGCCIGNTNYYCNSSQTVVSKTCTNGQVCTWNSSKSYYGCGAGPAMSDPNHPIACGTGSSSSSSSSSGSAGQDSSMTDIAVDSMGNLWGVSAHNAYQLEVQGSTVHCAKTIPLKNVPATFYALSFVPKGVIDTNQETLLAGDTQGDLWRIDTTTGALEQHGNFGAVPANDGQGHNYPSDAAVTGTTTTVGTPWQLSGDIVFLSDKNNGTLGFATVRDCVGSKCSNTDTLLQIDPTKLGPAGTTVTTDVSLAVRGQVVKASNCTDTTNANYGKMFGIAAWNSTIYGFSHDSILVAISNVDGSACAVSGMGTVESWSGAAVTTIAPVIPPPPPK